MIAFDDDVLISLATVFYHVEVESMDRLLFDCPFGKANWVTCFCEVDVPTKVRIGKQSSLGFVSLALGSN